jgi:hypothetical protein
METPLPLSTKLETVSGAEAAIGPAHAVGGANTVQVTLLVTGLTAPVDPILSAQVQASNTGQNWTLLGTVDASIADLGQPQSQAFGLAATYYRITVGTSPVDNVATFAIDAALSDQ